MVALLFIANQHAIAQKTIQSSDGVEVNIENISRIITIGGSITETVYALGFGDNVIATDVSSSYPSDVLSLPRVPYIRNLTSEGILSLSPTLIISSNDARPETAIQQIRDAGTNMLLIEEKETLQGVIDKIISIGKALGVEEKAKALAEQNRIKYNKSDSIRSTLTSNPSVMFILGGRGSGNYMVAGKNTGAAAIIELAGGKNAFTDFEGYKQATLESIVAVNPDYILMMDGRSHSVSADLKETPVINTIKAVKEDQLISMDGNYLLGFGPRFGSAILDLMEMLHPSVKIKL